MDHPPALAASLDNTSSSQSAGRPARRGRLARLRAAALGLTLPLLLAQGAAAQIGITQIRAGDLPITVVYPTKVVATPSSFGPYELTLARDAAPTPGNGRLVVLSHGSGGDAFGLQQLTDTLVRAGFVAALPEHHGDNWRDQSDSGPVSWRRRPREIIETIDAVARDARFAGQLQLDRVGAFGLSAGGLTGLALAGAHWSPGLLWRHCARHIDEDANFCLFGARSASEIAARRHSFSGPPPTDGPLASAPAGADAREDIENNKADIDNGADARDRRGRRHRHVHRARGADARDPRVAAVAVAVPVGAVFTPESLAAIRIPVGVVQAQSDHILNPVYHSGYVLAQCRACRELDTLPGAEHLDLLSPVPERVARMLALLPGGQRNPAIDDARRQQAFDRVAAFFRETLRPAQP